MAGHWRAHQPDHRRTVRYETRPGQQLQVDFGELWVLTLARTGEIDAGIEAAHEGEVGRAQAAMLP